MRIDSSGKVIINDNTIGDKLLLAGDNAGTARGLMFNCSTTTNQGDTWDIDAQSSTGIIKFSTGSSERMRIDSSGTVTIKNPTTSNLQLQSDQTTWVQNDVISNLNTYVSDTSAAGARDVAAIKVVNDQVGTNTTMSGVMTFYTSAYNAQMFERMRINGLGDVGIGTDSPETLLNVNSPSGTTYPTLGTASGVIALSINELHGMYLGVDGSSGNGWIQSMREDAGATAYNLILQPSGGNVGIGYTSPGSQLSIYKTAFGGDTAGSGGTLDFGVGSTKYWQFRLDSSSSGDLAIDKTYANVWTTPITIQRSSGNVGIGETSPSSKLDVVGANTSSIPLVELTASGTGLYQRGVRLLNRRYERTKQHNVCFGIC